ncbi:MAG: serine/threonine protein kinase [Gemmataceae bacterium]|nr:serine/threonine protein kinase [Gemmataceae bacterium]
MTQTHEQRLHEVLAEYLLAADSGQAPDRSTLLARYPDLATEIRSFLDNQEQVDRLADSMRLWKSASDHPPGAHFQSRSFGDFEILEIIGTGGMGVVYKARQISLNRIVALKMIRPGGRTPEDVEHFLRAEAAVAANLEHPNIVPIYEIGAFEGTAYISMKFIEGATLRERMAAGRKEHAPLALEDEGSGVRGQNARRRGDLVPTVPILAAVARAVHYAHERGILHRDLKPSNILIDAGRQPFVTDFGLAKRVSPGGAPVNDCAAAAESSQSGDIVGTPLYMAPEQAAGAQHLTTAADIYSLGAILFELLTGAPPYRGDSLLATLLLAQQADPVRPRALNPRVDRDLEAICLKCLEKDPSRRYGSALALAEDLERWRAGEPIHARRTSVWERAWKWAKRRPATAALVALLVLVPAAGLPAVTWLWQREARARADRDDVLVRERHSFYKFCMGLAQRDWQAGNVEDVKMHLAACPTELRDPQWQKLHAQAHAQLLKINHQAYEVLFSPDGRLLATTDRGNSVTLWDATTGANVATFACDAHRPIQLAFSADGKRLLSVNVKSFAADGLRTQVKCWDLENREEIADFVPAFSGSFHALCQDGRRLISANQLAIAVFNTETRKEQFTFPTTSKKHIQNLALSPDGKVLATSHSDMALRFWDLTKGLETDVVPLGDFKVGRLEFSLDGRLLAGLRALVAGQPSELRIWNAETRQEVKSFVGPTGSINAFTFTPDGRHLVSATNQISDRSIRIRDLMTTREVLTLRGHGHLISCLCFRADGRRLASASADGTVRIWNVPPLDE